MKEKLPESIIAFSACIFLGFSVFSISQCTAKQIKEMNETKRLEIQLNHQRLIRNQKIREESIRLETIKE